MTEFSQFWDGTTTGDASSSPYSSSEFAEAFVPILGAAASSSPFYLSSVSFAGYGITALAVTGTVSPVAVAAGHALVYGRHYLNDGAPALTVAVPTPGANPRIDRIVLRVDWSAQTIRAVRLAGAEAATPTPPALTQTAGTTWEVSLAQVYITTGGVITVRDERVGSLGLGPAVLFRDIASRQFEEFFDNFNAGTLTATALSSAGLGWIAALVGTGAATVNTGVPSSFLLSSGATNGGTATARRGNAVAGSNFFPTELAQAPLLFEARMQIATASDANSRIVMRLIDTAGTSYIQFGMIGSVSTANLALSNAAGGAATNFATGQAVDTAAYHTYGIGVAASGGPAVCYYDGVAIGQVAAAIPASTTDMRAEFAVDNGATSATRSMNVDWARLTRGA